MKKKIIVLFTILMVLNGFIQIQLYANEDEILILQDKVHLKSDLKNQKTVKELQIFERVKIVKNDLIKNHIQVKTADGKIGWVLVKYTTYITDEWKEHKFDSLVSIMLPKNQTFTTLEDKIPADINFKARIERKIYNKYYFIIIINSKENFVNYLKYELDNDQKPIFTKILFNNVIIYYCDNLTNPMETDMNGKGDPLYMILFEGKNNDSYDISISLWGAKESEDYFLTAKKILLSVKRKQ